MDEKEKRESDARIREVMRKIEEQILDGENHSFIMAAENNVMARGSDKYLFNVIANIMTASPGVVFLMTRHLDEIAQRALVEATERARLTKDNG